MSNVAMMELQIRDMMRRRNEAARDEQLALEGQLVAKTTTEHGKSYTRFYGDTAAAWAPFMPFARTVVRFDPKAGR